MYKMEWLKIKTSTELVRISTDEIVYVCADGNYSDLVLTNGRIRKMTFQLHFFDDVFKQLSNNTFVRVGRSVIVNKRYVFVINLTARGTETTDGTIGRRERMSKWRKIKIEV